MFGWGRSKKTSSSSSSQQSQAKKPAGRNADLLSSFGIDPSLLSDPVVGLEDDAEYEAELARALEEERQLNGGAPEPSAGQKKASASKKSQPSQPKVPQTASLMVDPNTDDVTVTDEGSHPLSFFLSFSVSVSMLLSSSSWWLTEKKKKKKKKRSP